ncbi:MAG: class I SAM-dependent methyltransferase [Cyclobacteriaceae bacterium]
MTNPTSADVRKMYDLYPYPSAEKSHSLMYDLGFICKMIFRKTAFQDARVLDLGCGTGNRIIGMAKLNPHASFMGVDMSEKSIEAAKALAEKNGVKNVRFIRSDIESLELPQLYDLVISTGVFHHMENPGKGFKSAYRHLRNGGLAYIWLYHSIGGYERSIDRELVQLFRNHRADQNDELGVEVLRYFEKTFREDFYGDATATKNSVDHFTLSVDAYCNPIIHTFRFDQISDLFEEAGFSEIIPAAFNRAGESKLINLTQQFENSYCLDISSQFGGGARDIFKTLHAEDQIRALELIWKPTGIASIGLKDDMSRANLSELMQAQPGFQLSNTSNS